MQRAEAAEIAELTGHDITVCWTLDPTFLGQHSKAQPMDALATTASPEVDESFAEAA